MKILKIMLIFGTVFSYAVGPTKVATFDRSLWGESLSTQSSFDKASRYEILSYVRQIINTNLSTTTVLKKFVGRKNVNLSSVQKWKKSTKEELLQNFQLAQKTCTTSNKFSLDLCKKVNSWAELSIMAREYTPKVNKKEWYKASQTFFAYYLYEQARLAALFPKITSEIDKLDASEVQGFNFEDGEFLLTFDDGPKFKRTEKLSLLLQEKDIHGLFFVLGNNLEKSLKVHGKKKIKKLYNGSCVGSHGFIHKSHQRLKTWKSSYDKTRALIANNNLQNTPKAKVWFRPPYGQRHKKLISYLATLNDTVMLWNIDSQDWNRNLSAKKVEDRVVTLMLLHRKGIILFHDIHPKAIKVVNVLNEYREQKTISWVDCRSFE